MSLSIPKCLLLPLRFRLSFSKPLLFSTSASINAIPAEGNSHSAMTHFLLTQCGFSQPQLPTIQKRRSSLSRSASTHRAQHAFQFLRDSGFTLQQVRKAILFNPSVLQLKVDEQLKPKIHLIKTLGLTDNDVAHVISQKPRILGCSLDKALRPKISILLNLYGSKNNLSKALTRNPSLLLFKVVKQLEPVINILKQSRIQGNLLLYLLSKGPDVLFGNSEESLKLKIEYVKNMGILEGSKAFMIALTAVDSCGLKNLEEKLKTIASIGLLEDVKSSSFLRSILVSLVSPLLRLKKNMNFLTHTAGFQPNIVVSYPVLLTYSIENRMHLRYKVLDYLRLMQPCQLLPSLAIVFHLSEKNFVEKFLSNNSHAAILYGSYKCKSVDI